jgi:hypothetical protein
MAWGCASPASRWLIAVRPTASEDAKNHYHPCRPAGA